MKKYPPIEIRSKQVRIRRKRNKNEWKAHSLDSGNDYVIKWEGEEKFTCTCIYYEKREIDCKHIVRVKLRGKIIS